MSRTSAAVCLVLACIFAGCEVKMPEPTEPERDTSGLPPKPNVPRGAKVVWQSSVTTAAPPRVKSAAYAKRQADWLPLYSPTPEEDVFLEDLEHRIFNYFWNEVFNESGIAFDHTDNKIGKVAATGFELAAIVIAVQRNWITYDEGYTRAYKILDFFWDNPADPSDRFVEGQFGLFWHFVDGETGVRKPVDCVAVCDSADFIAGAIIAGQYFRGTPVQELAQRLFDDVEWDRFVADDPAGGPGLISYGWVPLNVSESYYNVDGLLPFNMRGFDDNSLLTYAMALGADKHPITHRTWQLYVDGLTMGRYEGIDCIEAGQLFCRQVPQSFIRMSRKRDRKTDYFLDMANAYLADRAFSMKVNGYPPQVWGLNDCFGKDTYTHSAPPGPVNNDGTVCSASFVGALPHVPGLALESMKYVKDLLGERIWQEYGFSSSLNLKNNYVSPLYVGIELGPMIMMIENYRTGMIWDLFMRNRCMKNFMARSDMAGVVDDFELPPESPLYAAWTAAGAVLQINRESAQHGKLGLGVASTSETVAVTGKLSENDLLAFDFAKHLSLWARDLDVNACSLRIDGQDAPLHREAQVPGEGWVQVYFTLPAVTKTSLLTAVTIDVAAKGPRAALDNISLEGATDLQPPPAVPDLTVKAGTLGGSVELAWTAVPGGGQDRVTSYLVRYGGASEDAGSSVEFSARKNPGEFERRTIMLEPGRGYRFSIAAADEHGHVGPFSERVSATSNPQPLNRTAYDFEDGSLEGCRTSTRQMVLHVRSEPGSRLRNKVLEVRYTKEGAWDHLFLDVNPVMVAQHRYVTMNVRGKTRLLAKLWAGDDHQADVETLEGSDGAFATLRFDLQKAAMSGADREAVTKLLVFPDPGATTNSGVFYIDNVSYSN